MALKLCPLLLVIAGILLTRISGPDNDNLALAGVDAIPFGDILSGHSKTWVIADITPGERRFPGHPKPYQVSGTGILDQQKGLMVEVFGSLKVLHPLSHTALTGTENYDWTHSGYSGPHFNQNSDPPFVYGGIVVCQVHQSLQGASRYDPVYLIPSAWKQYLVAAYGYYTAHQSHFRTLPARPGNTDTVNSVMPLRKLLTDPNPFLMTLAVHTLAANGGLDTDVLAREAVKARGLRQGLLTFLILKYAPLSAKHTAANTLLQALKAATDATQVAGIALGTYMAERLTQRSSSDDEVTPLIDQLIKEKTALAHGVPVTNKYPKVGGISDSMSSADAYKYLSLVVDWF